MMRTLNHYTEKKPTTCDACGHWTGYRCRLGYVANKRSKACRQAVEIRVMARRVSNANKKHVCKL